MPTSASNPSHARKLPLNRNDAVVFVCFAHFSSRKNFNTPLITLITTLDDGNAPFSGDSFAYPR